MSNQIKGIIVDIGADTQPLEKALKGVNQTSRDMANELKQVERLLKLDPTNTELLAQKQKLLSDSIANTKDKLNTLKEAEKQAQDQFSQGKISEEQYRALQREIIATEQNLKKLENSSKELGTSLTRSLDAGAEKLNNFGSKTEELGKKMLPLTGVITGAAAGAFGLAVNAGKAADDINTLSKQTGLSTEEIQKFQFASDVIDVSLDTLTGSMAKLIKNMESARQGSKNQEEAFKTLGVEIVNVDGSLRNNQEVFNEAINALGKMENETQRDALAMQIFGKSAQDLNPLILGGADALTELGKQAEEAGLILSQDALDSINEFNDELDILKATASGTFAELGTEIGTMLMPFLKELVGKLKDLQEWVRGLDQDQLIGTIALVVAAIGPLLIFIGKMSTGVGAIVGIVSKLIPIITTVAGTVLPALGSAFAFLAANPIVLIIAAIAAIIAIFVALWKNCDEFREFFINLWNKIVETVNKAWEGIKKGFDGFIKFFTEDIGKFMSDIWKSFLDWAGNFIDIGKNIVNGVWEGIKGMASWLSDKVTGFFSGIVSGVKNILGIKSPSRVFRDEVGKFMAQGVGVGFTQEFKSIKDKINAELSVNNFGSNATPVNQGTTIHQTNNFSNYKPRDGIRTVRDLNRKLGLAYN